jgi:hypothetical protein
MMNETQEQLRAGYTDFDFLIGRWKIRHRRLREILKGSTSWDDFEGHAVDRKILGGLGSISEVTLHLASGPLQGMTVRLFDPRAEQWRIYWTAGPDGAFTTPMIGGFAQGRGMFYAHEPYDGRYVLSRFLWSDITPTSCHWEQAFSADGGATWETNWIMDLAIDQG